jgi:tRNA-binding protein
MNDAMQQIQWEDFLRVELRVGRVLSARPFPEARKPAYMLEVDFGPEIGVRKSSCPAHRALPAGGPRGRLVVGVVNFPKKPIGPLMSECLVTGFHDADGGVVLCVPDGEVPPGTRLL